MGAADCELCELMGHRTCDVCGGSFHPGNGGRVTAFGVELCDECDRSKLRAEP